MWLSQISMAFLQTQKGIPLFIAQLVNILEMIDTAFVLILAIFLETTSLNSASVTEFCERDQAKIDECIPDRKFQVKPHSSTCFSIACVAALFIEIIFFLCTNILNILRLRLSSDD